MNIQARYLTGAIKEDLKEKMIFLGGSRQVGKTTIAKELLAGFFRSSYFNWDRIASRRAALKGEWPPDAELVILDEFHKNPRWKTWLKGEYDTYKERYKFLLTGSARMNVYRKGGDSLQGRYHYYTLHPFSVAEFNGFIPTVKPGEELVFREDKKKCFEDLLAYGGFPESFLKKDPRFLRRWHNERLERFFKEDIRDLTNIKDFANLTLLSGLLPERVASVLSVNALAQDLQVNFRTVAHWLDVFEQFYYCYRLAPFQSKRIKSVRKEKKLYLWDWSQVAQEGARLENMVASHLLKFCDYLKEYQGYPVELHYLRDVTGSEIDFLVSHKGDPWFSVEVKRGDNDVPKKTHTLSKAVAAPFNYLIAKNCEKERMQDRVRIMPAAKFLSGLV